MTRSASSAESELIIIPYPLVHPGFHFGGGFPGKGDKNDLTRRNIQLPVAEHIKSTFNRQVCFSGTRTGRYKEVFIEIMFAEALPVEAIPHSQENQKTLIPLIFLQWIQVVLFQITDIPKEFQF